MNRAHLSFVLLGLCLLGLVPGAATRASPGPDPRELVSGLMALDLDETHSVPVHDVEILEGFARIRLIEGRLTPVTPLSRSMEVVFIGRGQVTIEPPDEIEAGQLDLFTGSRTLDAEFHKAVLVVPRSATFQRLVGDAPAASDPDGTSRAAARALWKTWREGPVRRFVGVDAVLVRAGCGEKAAEEFFAAWFGSKELGDFLYQVDPDAEEPVTLGHFVPPDPKERKKVEKEIEEEQEQNHWVGLELADLGRFDVWLSAGFTGPSGDPVRGTSPVEPEHYALDVTVDKFVESISGKARLSLRAVRGGRRAIPLTLSVDLRVDGVRDGSGNDLPFLRAGSAVSVLLPAPLEDGGRITLDVAFSGNPFFEASVSSFALRDTLGWYPHAGSRDRATYELTMRWPKKYDLLCSGRRLEEGVEDVVRWEKHVVDTPVRGVTFETGEFDVREARAGHVAITVAFDKTALAFIRSQKILKKETVGSVEQDILDTVKDSLAYYEEIFGPYPLDELKVVTAPRSFSQGLTGFLTLEDYVVAMMRQPTQDTHFTRSSLGHSRRTIVAHEVAHQWWGHIVDAPSYRDQWLEEALADYSALLYQRNRLKVDEAVQRGPTRDWLDRLERTTTEGRPLESIGPLTLGRRLASSKSDDAYVVLVYTKGPIVINMLEKVFKEDAFVKILGSLSREFAGRSMSTRQFFAGIEGRTHEDLGWFVDQYVHGTGIPDILYSYELGATGTGAWQVGGKLRLVPPHLFRYRVVANPGYDVQREIVPQSADTRWKLIVPIQIPTHRPPEGGASRKDDPRKINAQINGRLLMEEMNTPFSVEVRQEPLGLWMDRYGEVLAHFFSENRFPRSARRIQGEELAAAGKRDEAETAFRAALAAPALGTSQGAETDLIVTRRDEARSRREETWIHLALARIKIERGDPNEAGREIDAARRAIQNDESWLHRAELLVLDSRLDLLRGDVAGAYRRLRAGIRNRGIDDVEAYALLAVAAKRANRPDDLEEALDLARRHGVDVRALEPVK